MRIIIIGISHTKLRRSFEQIARLFYETVAIELYATSEESAACAPIADAERVDSIIIDLRHVGQLPSGRAYKYALLRQFLIALQEKTGVVQPWGVLTGVRPMKLWHQKWLAGVTQVEAKRALEAECMIAPERIDLLEQIANSQLAVVPDLYALKNAVSIYIGIPFCPTKCAYCTFPAYAIVGKETMVEAFLTCLEEEMRAIADWLTVNQVPITTIYFGGGTPTSISAEQMDRLYASMYNYFPGMEVVREITVEAGRPDTLTDEKLAVLQKWQIERISINPQSFHEETLKVIGRHHTTAETIEKFHIARSTGFSNINMDLIIGLPGEGIDHFQSTLTQMKELNPESVTVHTLAFKRASEMTKNKQRYKVASGDEVKAMMQMATDWTGLNGYFPYYLYRQQNILGNLENIGYAKPGNESMYNIIIMEEAQTIIGLGCGAASKFINKETGEITRYANPKDPKTYIENTAKVIREKLDRLPALFTK